MSICLFVFFCLCRSMSVCLCLSVCLSICLALSLSLCFFCHRVRFYALNGLCAQCDRKQGRRCVRLCYLANSGRSFVCVFMCVRVYVCACVCARVCVCVAIPRLFGSANSLISAARVCVCMCVCVCFAIGRQCGSANSFRPHNG